MTILIWRVACRAEEYTESFVENGSHLVDDLGMKTLLCVPTPPELDNAGSLVRGIEVQR